MLIFQFKKPHTHSESTHKSTLGPPEEPCQKTKHINLIKKKKKNLINTISFDKYSTPTDYKSFKEKKVKRTEKHITLNKRSKTFALVNDQTILLPHPKFSFYYKPHLNRGINYNSKENKGGTKISKNSGFESFRPFFSK